MSVSWRTFSTDHLLATEERSVLKGYNPSRGEELQSGMSSLYILPWIWLWQRTFEGVFVPGEEAKPAYVGII
jgi:hypothetical protein